MSRFICFERTTGKEVKYMRKKIVIGALVPLVAALGLWLAMGSASATHTAHKTKAQWNEVSTGADSDNIQSGDQTTPDTEAAKASTESDDASGTEPENQGESGGESEGAADAAAQHADCLKAGIDDTATSNVQYDDQTGACSLDTGTDNGGND